MNEMAPNQSALEEILEAFDAGKQEGYAETDWTRDVIDSLLLLKLSLGYIESEPSFAVRWSVVAAHSAATSALAAHVSGTANLGALERRSYEQHCKALDEGLPFPSREAVASFSELLQRATEKDAMLEPIGDVRTKTGMLEIDPADIEKLAKLNTLRNRFVHFNSSDWTIEIAYALSAVDAAIRLVREILSYGWAFRADHHASTQIGTLLLGCESALRRSSDAASA